MMTEDEWVTKTEKLVPCEYIGVPWKDGTLQLDGRFTVDQLRQILVWMDEFLTAKVSA